MSTWLRKELAKAQEQLDVNPRLRLGVIAIPLITLLYLNLLLGDYRVEQQGVIAERHQELLDAQQLAKQDEWVERLELVRARLDQQVKQRFGHADSEAFARADIQANAQSLLGAQRLQQIRIEVSTAGKPDPAIQLVSLQLRLSGNAQGEQLFALIDAMENASPTYRIDSLNVSVQRNSHLVFSLVASIWYVPWGSP